PAWSVGDWKLNARCSVVCISFRMVTPWRAAAALVARCISVDIGILIRVWLLMIHPMISANNIEY
ncbi:MAG: hypothetical protein KDK05_12905, partial [Candidatus Competibacteraceae bacterium]|nr:hypothetical protein [Candidatus Competibacteraceae bacterium]